MKSLFVLALMCSGCTTFHSKQISKDGTITDVRVSTFWDSKTELAKLRVSTSEKTQTTGLATLISESNSTNAVALIEAVVSAAIKAAVRP